MKTREPLVAAMRQIDEMRLSTIHRVICLIAVCVFVFVSAACDGGGSQAREGTGTFVVDDDGAQVEKTNRDANIYAAVVRQLVRKDNTFGGGDPGFKIVYVINGTVEDAADPTNPLKEYEAEEPFPHDVQDGVRFMSKLHDLPPVEFVSERDSVVTREHGGSDPGRVKNHGVLIALGPIQTTGNTVEVATSLWINGLAGQWLTYVLAESNGRWKFTGTTGTMAIS
jgi:hypothetical protein